MSDGFLSALERGIGLFNARDYHGAYEVWFERWNEEESEGAGLLRGLLQIAFGFAKLEHSDLRAASKLLASGVSHLAPYRPDSYGVDVDGMMQRVQGVQRDIEVALEAKSAPASEPQSGHEN